MGLTIDGTEVRFEIAPDDGLFTESPTFQELDGVRSVTSVSSGRTTEIDQPQPGNIEAMVDNRERLVDLAYGPARVTFDGSGSDYWACGDLAAFSGATELDVRAAVSADDWTPGATMTIEAQWNTTGNQRCWQLYVDTSGFLALNTSTAGTAGSAVGATSGYRVSAVDGQTICVRATWVTAAGAVYFYVKRTTRGRERLDCLSHDGWAQVGGVKTGVTAALFNSSAVVTVGDREGSTQPWDGSVLYCDARTTVGGDTLAFAFWPADAASAAATSWVASAGAGETWSKTGTSTITVQGSLFNRLGSGTPVRVVATRSAVDYPLGYGYLRRAPQAFPASGRDAVARLTAGDTLAWLAEQQAPSTPSQFGTGKVGHYWPLHENQNVLQAADVVGAAAATWSNVRVAGGPTQPGARGLPTGTLVEGTYLVTSQATSLPLYDGSIVLTASVYLASESSVFRIMCSDGTNTLGINYGVGGTFSIQGGASVLAETFQQRFEPGMHTLFLYSSGGGVLAYIDGIRLEPESTVARFVGTAAVYCDGTGGCAVSDIALYLDDSQNTAAQLGATGGDGQTSGERMTALLQGAMGNKPALWTITSDVTTYLGPTGLGGSYGALALQVNTAEQGRFHQDGDGVVIFRSRNWCRTATAATVSQATFGDGAGEVPYADITIDPGSREDVINDVTVTLPNGTSGNYVDRESVTANGLRSRTFSAPLAAPADATGLARHIVGLRAWPQTRVTGLVINPLGSSAAWTQVLTRKVGDRITVKRRTTETTTPSSVTEPISAEVCIEQITHSIDRSGTWRTTYLTSPAPPTAAEAGYFTFDDAVLGQFDAGLSFAY